MLRDQPAATTTLRTKLTEDPADEAAGEGGGGGGGAEAAVRGRSVPSPEAEAASIALPLGSRSLLFRPLRRGLRSSLLFLLQPVVAPSSCPRSSAGGPVFRLLKAF